MDYSGDFQLNIFFFLPMQFVGMYTWYYHLDSADTAQAASLGWLRRLATVLLMFALGVGMYYEIPAFSKALAGVYAYEDMPWPHALDAASVTLSIAAQVLQTGRFWEQWLAWIAVDIVQIAMFAGIAGFGIDFNLITMWSLFLINAVVGAVLWYRRSRDPDAHAAKPDPERALTMTHDNVNSSLSTLADGATPPHSPLDHAPSDTEGALGTPRTGLLNANARS
ncbi:nicotinamide mononucleotide transporter PnuC [Allomyces macrogynus ATCC 38327]|uniref:Nicotinamide mononucleotide transporter PnuC n=1 Tax=Allomyces macrogynus (strain ATCC 38327) TaxID=578462 RepID=A0A0L0SNA4_ALLM3|nr:nicotinamide mononucleotide transporter PnuC [Allomyces macrogynus ATCC 38327]|eukprot:KNE64001.1 nicotinamide mononucleotide transporter PnuC [Allomyces macrogynus ATCC 38327]